jgi:dGTPase
MLDRQAIEERELSLLCPYAVLSSKTQGRQHESQKDPFRTCFQQDRDRVIHSSAFRRLEYKTQVFVNHEGDYYRTRLTHTLETAQIGRSAARSLGLNEDLVEAAALAHDLGHTPFGHAGQDAMNSLMKEFGGFEHNLQSMRIVDFLEIHNPEFRGLNLSVETREAIAKHSQHKMEGMPAGWCSLEGQLVDIVDSVAYLAADLDDGLHSGILNFDQLNELELVKAAREKIKSLGKSTDFSRTRHPLISQIISILVEDLITQSQKNIEESKVDSLEDVRSYKDQLIGFSNDIAQVKGRTHVLLNTNFYQHPRVKRMSHKAFVFLNQLFDIYMKTPELLPLEHQNNFDDFGVPRVLCDYISGMTDRFAINELAQLSIPIKF